MPYINFPKKYIEITTQCFYNTLRLHKYTKNVTTAVHKHEKMKTMNLILPEQQNELQTTIITKY